LQGFDWLATPEQGTIANAFSTLWKMLFFWRMKFMIRRYSGSAEGTWSMSGVNTIDGMKRNIETMIQKTPARIGTKRPGNQAGGREVNTVGTFVGRLLKKGG
jgi:hypothetical protein